MSGWHPPRSESELEGWVKYTGHYHKIFYDIKLVDGTIHKQCWPNAGFFVAVNTRDPQLSFGISEIDSIRPDPTGGWPADK